jgi:hypothetical protein
LLAGENGAVPRFAGVMADAGRGVSGQDNTLAVILVSAGINDTHIAALRS